ncbi:MAG TPA: efflux RND transporter permease subunit [Gammaproteobacteria bacterium]|jgi:hydrophobe/amphiphile efflux-1 (HAE1) family protein|nr:efflux RND transporter permease subunit [Gammaproteobacteria bacterium]
MKFTDLFIKRPVLATVISLGILLLGLKSINSLELRQFPKLENSQITVSTAYPGASADVIQGFITTPIQQAVASAEGIDYITSSSQQSVSTITINLKLNYDPHKALVDIMSDVDTVKSVLPAASQAPIIQANDVRGAAIMYISFYSKEMSQGQVTDYLTRVVQPKLQTLDGVAGAQILGGQPFAMRIWLDPKRMAAHGITATDVSTALVANNFLAAPGSTKGSSVSINIAATTDLHDAKGFGDIVLRKDGDALVRIRDVADVELGAENYDSSASFNGITAVYMAINPTPDANPLEVVKLIRKAMVEVQAGLPPALQSHIAYDATKFISSSIYEVMKTIVEAALIVILVIFLFLGALRPVIIPVITIPLSLVGVTFLMLLLGYSLNLLTLLAMVLAIGLVVDDAIVVVENTHRHIEEGKSPMEAALMSAREIATPVIAMTLTLAAVYAPIGFLSGVTGNLFREFAFTLAGSVVISGIIALTLSPMMCSRILQPVGKVGKLEEKLNHIFEGLKERYEHLLHDVLKWRPVTVFVAGFVVILCVLFYTMSAKELAPTEDQGFVFVTGFGEKDVTHDVMTRYAGQVNDIFKSIPEGDAYFLINGLGSVNNFIGGIVLKPWEQRKRTQQEVQQEIQGKLGNISGINAFSVNFPALPGASQGGVSYVVSSTDDYKTIYDVTQKILAAARKSGMFYYVDSDLKFNTPQLNIDIDHDKAQQLGISMQDAANSLSVMLGGGYLNFFNLNGRSYKVIPQVADQFRRGGDQLQQYYVRTASGSMVPISTIANINSSVVPDQLNQFQQLNSATISGFGNAPMGKTVDFLNQQAKEFFPPGFYVNYAADTRQFVQEGNALVWTMLFAIIVIFLVLAAQFESWRDPLVIMFSVPLAFFGALIPIAMGVIPGLSINIYTQVGLVTLIGLISKHGILMVDFANKMQEHEGMSVREAIEHAAAVRLRPILMTTASMVLGVLPLIIASGAGATSRRDIGIVIAAGMTIGTLFTLFVVPTMYTFFARNHQEEAGHKV